MLKRRFQLMLLTTAVLAVFYPSIFGEFNTLDDVGMVTSLLNMDDWSLKGLFLPSASEGLYYRPLLYATFIFDRFFWFLSTSFMHLENILFHLANTLLVFSLAKELLPETEKKSSYLPVIAALCFGLHPLSTEPVSWVSGRTDVMAGTFVLLSAVFLLKFKLEGKKTFFFCSIFALLLGMLSKEVALAFLPGAFLIIIAKLPQENPCKIMSENPLGQVAKKLLLFTAIGVGSALLFFLLRSFAFTSNSPRISMTLKFIFNDLGHAVFVFLRAFGFYMKKLYWPFPLNFAIVEVDPLYELLAMPIVLLCIILMFKRTLISATFLAGVFMITPAFLIAYNQVAWTPYAERYIYIASAFIMTSTVLFLGRQLQHDSYGLAVKAGLPCLLALIGFTTLQRNLTWQTNLGLYGDTVKKSPDFSKVWNEYGIAYYYKKDMRNAARCFAKASSLYSLYYDEKSDINLAEVLFLDGKMSDAAAVYSRVFKKGGEKSVVVLEHYLEFLGKKAAREKDPSTVVQNMREELKYNTKLYALTGKPVVLYRMGVLSQALGNRQGAQEFYRQAYEKLPQGDRYKKMAMRQLAEIEDK